MSGTGNKIALGLSLAQIAQSKNKLTETLKVMKEMALWKITLPVALLGGLSGLQKMVRSLASDTGALQSAMDRVGKIKIYQGQLEPLLKSAGAARQRLAELMQFERKSPFNLGQVVAASRALEIFGNGALKSSNSLKLVEQIAKSSGSGIEASADAFGSFYRAMKGGQPVAAAAAELQRMGVINEQTINQLTEMQTAGASWSEMFSKAEGAISSATSGADQFSDSMEGVQKQLEDAQSQMSSAFGKPFMDAEVSSMKTALHVAQKLTPVMDALGKPLARLSSQGDSVKNFAKEGMASLAGTAAPAAGMAGNLLETGVAGGGIYAAIKAVMASASIPGLYGKGKSTVSGFLTRGVGGAAKGADFLSSTMIGPRLENGAFEEGLGGLLKSKAIDSGAGALRSVGPTSDKALTAVSRFAAAPFSAIANGFKMIVGAITPMGWVVTIATVAAAAIKTLTDGMDAQTEKAKALHDSNLGVESSIRGMITSARTAEDAFAALSKAQEAVVSAQEQMRNAKGPGWWDKTVAAVTGTTAFDARDEAKSHLGKVNAEERSARQLAQGGMMSQAEKTAMDADAERELRYKNLTAENAIANAHGQDKVDLLKQQGSEFAEKGAAADSYKDARAKFETQSQGIHMDDGAVNGAYSAAEQRLAKANANPKFDEAARKERADALIEFNAAKANKDIQGKETTARDRISLRASGNSLLMQQANLGDQSDALEKDYKDKKLSPTEYADQSRALQKKKSDLNAIIGDLTNGNYGERAKQNREVAVPQAQFEENIAKIRVQAESDIAGLKEVGADRTSKEWSIRKSALQLELDAEKARPNQNLQRQKELAAQIESGGIASSEQARGTAVYQEGSERDLATKKAWREGRGAEAVSLSDLSDFASKYEDARGQLGDTPAALDLAKRQTNEDISSSAAELARNPVVDSLQRIAGGGGASADPMITEAQRHTNLLNAIEVHLKNIAGKKGGADGIYFGDPE